MTQAKRRNIVFGVEEKFLLGIQDTVHHYYVHSMCTQKPRTVRLCYTV